MKPMLGLRNRLVRRLGKHANMTGLFHVGEAVQRQAVRPGEPETASAASVAGLPLTKAFAPMPEPAEQADLVPPVLAPSNPVPSAAPFAAPELPLEQPKPASDRVEPPQSVPSGNVFRAPETDHISAPAAEEKSQPSDGDAVWNRLQNIFNKHKSKNTPQEADSQPQSQEGESSSPDLSAAATEESGQASSSLKNLELRPGNEPRVASIQMKREAASSSPEQHADTLSPGIKNETTFAPAEQGPASAESSSSTAAAPTDVIQAAFEGSPSVNLPSSTQVDEVTPAKPHDLPRNETREPVQDEQPFESLSQAMMEAPDTDATHLQSLPLQAVWAVETVRQPQTTFPPTPEESDKHIFGGEGIDRPAEPANADQTSVQRAELGDEIVRSALQDVQTAQTSESGIEFLPPRRPRPVPAAVGSNEPVRESVHPPSETPQAVVQRRADTGPQNEPVEPGLVPTEIGPLPEDLWNLVGAATPPITNEAPHERPALGEISKWAEQSPLSSAALAASPIGPTGQAPVVQRQAAPPATAELGSAPPPAGGDASGEQAGDDVNIEELARQVYSELKHRLGLEWERLRRR